jgi:hypothetical protein
LIKIKIYDIFLKREENMDSNKDEWIKELEKIKKQKVNIVSERQFLSIP